MLGKVDLENFWRGNRGKEGAEGIVERAKKLDKEKNLKKIGVN